MDVLTPAEDEIKDNEMFFFKLAVDKLHTHRVKNNLGFDSINEMVANETEADKNKYLNGIDCCQVVAYSNHLRVTFIRFCRNSA